MGSSAKQSWADRLIACATPPAAVAALGAAFRDAIQQSAPALNFMAGVTPRAGYETPEQVMALIRTSVAQHTATLRAAGFQPE